MQRVCLINTLRSPYLKDSLQGKCIEPGHRIIYFGKGEWTEDDIVNLQNVLSRTSVRPDGEQEGYRLPKDMHVAHYRFVVEELVIKFREVKKYFYTTNL